tara:strand:- start:10 stop:564 length:555 start_codon:yes stop_codon:yes gene_type:complete
MKPINLFKSVPFLITFVFVLILCISNQKEYTKLKVLIWDTPRLSLGTYIAISVSSGFFLSFVVNKYISKTNPLKPQIVFKYKSEIEEVESNPYQEDFNEISYDNTWIERDIKDPTPTMNASFRVIGKNNRKYRAVNNDFSNDYETSDFPEETDNLYGENEDYNDKNNGANQLLNDWDDYSYANW